MLKHLTQYEKCVLVSKIMKSCFVLILGIEIKVLFVSLKFTDEPEVRKITALF